MLLPAELDDQMVETIRRRLREITGLDLTHYKPRYLKRRLTVRMRATGSATFQAYIKLIVPGSPELADLIDDVTINVTHFFRDEDVFVLLEEEVLPLIIYDHVRKRDPRINIWSAGCSSGEEVYSLAIMVSELMGDHISDYDVEILGVDLDEPSLEVATRGVYGENQIASVPGDRLDAHFRKVGPGFWEVRDHLRSMVRFTRGDLFQTRSMGKFDLILCRNVMIYFSREMQERLFEHFHQQLDPGGYLVVGKTETLMGEARELFDAYNIRSRIFKRRAR